MLKEKLENLKEKYKDVSINFKDADRKRQTER